MKYARPALAAVLLSMLLGVAACEEEPAEEAAEEVGEAAEEVVDEADDAT